MTLQSNVIAFPADLGGLPPDQMQEIRDTGFTYYRHAQDDRIRQFAILWAACLIQCDLAIGDPDPQAALEVNFRDMRAETEALIATMQSN